ncbi:hypothetical protein EV182_006296, partial [Spiromyces aspiralis]
PRCSSTSRRSAGSKMLVTTMSATSTARSPNRLHKSAHAIQMIHLPRTLGASAISGSARTLPSRSYLSDWVFP